MYYQRNGYWYSIPRQVFSNPILGYPRPPAITFAGDDTIGSCGDTPQAKRMRVAQIHVACPIRSAADDILWNERKLKEAMIEQFDDTEADEQDQEDILSIMSGLEQGERNVLKILRRKPAKVNQFDKILIRQRLHSNETPYKVVKGLKMKGDVTESSDEEDSSNSEDNKAYKRSEKSEKRSGKRYQDKFKKKSRGHEGDSIRDEHLMESRKDSSTTTGTNVIPLDSYAVNRTYGNYPPQDRYGYEQRNQICQLASADSDRSPQERGRMGLATFDTFQNSYQTPQPIVSPNGVLYYPARNTIICYNCGEEGHMHPHCLKLRSYGLHSTLAETETERIDPKRASDLLPTPPPPPLARGSDRAVSVVELATVSSAEVSVAEVDEKKVPDGKDDEDDMPLPPEFDGEAGPASQRQRTDDVEEVISKAHAVGQPPIRMMAGREKFDFVGAFRDALVLAPTVKKDICRLLAKRRGTPGEVQSVVTDRDLGDVANFYTRGRYRIARILVDTGSLLLKAIGAKMMRTNGKVIRTATNALARIAHCADLRITVAGVPCDLRYSPTYPMLLIKAKGDYTGGRYYIMSGHGTQNYKGKVRETERGDKEVSRGQLSAEETQGGREEADEQMKEEEDD
ncbi:hypothetical protein L873DRAFT_1806286, partial [Choiromyces venosus 120613-1]